MLCSFDTVLGVFGDGLLAIKLFDIVVGVCGDGPVVIEQMV
jgi:hypothetical protein